MNQPDLFPKENVKAFNIDSSSKHHARELETARNVAIELASHRGQISIEDVRKGLAMRGISLKSGNWMGSVFRGKEWLAVGFVPSQHEGGHGRVVRTWRLKESPNNSNFNPT